MGPVARSVSIIAPPWSSLAIRKSVQGRDDRLRMRQERGVRGTVNDHQRSMRKRARQPPPCGDRGKRVAIAGDDQRRLRNRAYPAAKVARGEELERVAQRLRRRVAAREQM